MTGTNRTGPTGGLTVLQDDGKSLVLRLPGLHGGSVIAKRGHWRSVRRELVAYRALPGWPRRFAPRLLGGRRDGRNGWLFVEEVAGTPIDAGRPGDRRRLAAWLAELHRASAGRATWPSPLPRTVLAAHRERLDARIRGLRGRLERTVDDDERDDVRALLAVLGRVRDRWSIVESWAATMPHVLVHGDLSPENVVTESMPPRRLLAFDWADAGVGPPLADLHAVDLGTYRSLAGDLWPDRTLGRLDAIGRMASVARTIRHRLERKDAASLTRYRVRLQRDAEEAGLA